MPANPTNADIIASVAQLHLCVEDIGERSRTDNHTLGLRVDALAGQVEGMKTAAEATSANVADLIVNKQATRDLVTKKFDDLNKAAWKFVGAIGLAMFGGAVTIVVAIILNGLSLRHQAQSIHQDASVAAARAPAEDDREADRDARLLAAIAAMKTSK